MQLHTRAEVNIKQGRLSVYSGERCLYPSRNSKYTEQHMVLSLFRCVHRGGFFNRSPVYILFVFNDASDEVETQAGKCKRAFLVSEPRICLVKKCLISGSLWSEKPWRDPATSLLDKGVSLRPGWDCDNFVKSAHLWWDGGKSPWPVDKTITRVPPVSSLVKDSEAGLCAASSQLIFLSIKCREIVKNASLQSLSPRWRLHMSCFVPPVYWNHRESWW